MDADQRQVYEKLLTVERKVDDVRIRVDEVVLDRLRRVEEKVDKHETRLNRLDIRVFGYIAGVAAGIAIVGKATGAW